MPLQNKQILLIISGGIAAYKSLELIRLLKRGGASVRCILTKGGAEFITPLSVASLSEHPVYTDLFSLKDESEMGHIRLSRESDLIIITPCSANMISKIAQGRADDLASTCVLASNKPVLIAPAMNVEMWQDTATQRNLNTITARADFHVIGPAAGEMACGEVGLGRMVEPQAILEWTHEFFKLQNQLTGKRAIVTAGPTVEPIDPVRYISNYSSGKQGYAIAEMLAFAGAQVTLISGPTHLRVPAGVTLISVQTADEMNIAVAKQLHTKTDIAVCTAAVADFKPVHTATQKIKKTNDQEQITLTLTKNPDILKTICQSPHRPALVIGFAAETEQTIENAIQKRASKGCDWMVANTVGQTDSPVFGQDDNQVTIITQNAEIPVNNTSKRKIAAILTRKICDYLIFSRTEIEQSEDQNHDQFCDASRAQRN